MEWFPGKGQESEFEVEAACSFVFGEDDYGKNPYDLGDGQYLPQDVDQEKLAQPLTARGKIDRKPRKGHDGDGMAREFAADFGRPLVECDAAAGYRIEAEDALRTRTNGNERAAYPPVLVLFGVSSQKLVERGLSAIEEPALMSPRKGLDPAARTRAAQAGAWRTTRSS